MKVVAAYLLAVLGGKAIGAECENDRIGLLLSEISDKNITELIASGREKLASVPFGGGGTVAMVAPVGAGGAPAAPAAKSKKEEKVEEKKESDDELERLLF